MVIMMRTATEYQTVVAEQLKRIYAPEHVKTEWDAMLSEERNPFSGTEEALRTMYGPRIDIAVGPFATRRQLSEEYDDLMDSSWYFIDEILRSFHQNANELEVFPTLTSYRELRCLNRNARCFLAIEIEKGNRDLKYLMGSILNAAALGRIGIAVGWDGVKLQELFKLREYLLALKRREKNTLDTTNLIILEKEQLRQAVENTIASGEVRSRPPRRAKVRAGAVGN